MMISKPADDAVVKVLSSWEAEKVKKEKEVSDDIFKIFKDAIDNNLLTDRMSQGETPLPNLWIVEVSNPYCALFDQKILECLTWLGMSAKMTTSKTELVEGEHLLKYCFEVSLKPGHESDPAKKNELKKCGWLWNKYERNQLIERISKLANHEYRRLLDKIEREMKSHPFYERWVIFENKVSERVLNWVKENFESNGFAITAAIGKENNVELAITKSDD